jgi:hypothetical protein
VKIAWDAQSDLNGSMTMNGYTDLTIAKYNGAKWDTVTSTPAGTNSVGDVITTNSVNISTTPINFSIGSTASTRPIATLSPGGLKKN